MKEEGLRFNEGKLRVDLVPPSAIRGIAEVLGFGAQKYAENNWRKGMKWSKVISSLERHLLELKDGVDYDVESKLMHIDHILTNAAFLKEYYKIAPHFDDRHHKYLAPPKIGLDIDDVLADWTGEFCKLLGEDVPTSWNFGFIEKVKALIDGGVDYPDVMSKLPVKTRPEDIPFEPHCYITSRNHTDVSVAEKWLADNGFPQTKVIQTNDKVAAALEMELDVFVDDSYTNFIKLNNAGICTYLFDALHNQRYDVGYKRIKSLKELA